MFCNNRGKELKGEYGTSCGENIIEKSVKQARQNLPIGEILSEETKTQIVEDTMFAITTIKVNGIIND